MGLYLAVGALRRADRARRPRTHRGGAPQWLRPETYVEPFAFRALGFARAGDGLIEQAVERFEAMGLDWHAAETRKLLVHA